MIENNNNLSVLFVIVFSAFLWMGGYYIVSRVERNSINFMTPALFTFFPTCYFFEFIYVYLTPKNLNLSAYVYFFSLYSFSVIALVLGYIYSIDNKIIIFQQRIMNRYSDNRLSQCYMVMAVLSSLLSFLLYLPIIIEFKDYLATPRRIYELTRTGYGLSFFTSNLLALLSLLFCLYSYNRYKLLIFISFSLSLIVIYLHGSKTAILSIFLIYVLYKSSISNKTYNLKYVFIFVSLIALLMSMFFWLTFNIEITQVFLAMAGYSDYTRNAILLYEKSIDFEMGRLLIETEFYSRVPRALFPDKPNDFGYLELAKIYFPEAFYLNQGAPSFGFGSYYADFGYLTHIIISILFFFKGTLVGMFRNQLRIDGGAYIFVPFIFLAGVELLTLGTGWLFIEHVLLAVFIFICMLFFVRLSNVYSKSF